MSDFSGFNELYVQDDKRLNVPSIQIRRDSKLPASELLSKSLDIKKQLSQSFGNSGVSGGISKPQSRKNSIIPIRSNDGSDADDDDQGNERKRRDNINEKIQELLTLVPPEFFQEVPDKNPANEDDQDAAINAAMKNSGTKDGKPNKGQILTKSVEYIQYLQNLIDENNRKEIELTMRLKKLQLQQEGKASNVPVPIEHTSAERALGQIGVGPLSDEYFKQVLVGSSGKRRGSFSG